MESPPSDLTPIDHADAPPGDLLPIAGDHPPTDLQSIPQGSELFDALRNSRPGLILQGLGNIAQAAAPVLEPLRTPNVGLGGLLAGAKAVASGQDFLPAASKSIEERRGTGREIVDPLLSPEAHPIANPVASIATEFLTDPVTYVSGPLIGKLSGLLERGSPKATAVVDEVVSKVAPKVAPENIVLPSQASDFKVPPLAPLEEDGARRASSTASKFINLNRLRDESAKEIIGGLSNEPAFVKSVMDQKRGVIPLADSKAAGEALGLVKEDFAKLKPGQILRRGTLDAQTAAASAMQNMAANDLYDIAKMRANGAPIEELADRIAINYKAIVGAQGVISESGRALGAVRLSDRERALAKVAQLAFKERLLEDPVKLDAFLKEVAELPNDAIAQRLLAAKKLLPEDHSFLAMMQEARAASLLTNPVTYIRNLAGNSLAAMSNLIERPLAGAVDFLSSKLTGSPQQVALGEGMANSYGMWSSMPAAARDALDVLMNERSLKGHASEFAGMGGAIPGKLGSVVRLPFNILNATDTFFKSILSGAEMHRLAFRQAAMEEGLTGVARAKRAAELAANPSKEMVDAALSTAKEFTFQSDLEGSLAKMSSILNQKDTIGVVSRFMVPFFKTPVNIAKFAIERTPILSELTKRGVFRTAFLESGATRRQVSEAVARNLVGTMAITSGSLALKANEGRITGAPPLNPAERENLMSSGWRPYSIKIGDLYIPYRGIEPAASYLGAIADWSRIVRENPESSAAQKVPSILASSIRNFVNQPFLQNIKDVLDVVEASDDKGFKSKIAAIAKNQASSVIPTGVSLLARERDKTIRNPETFVESIMAKVPILSERVRPKLTRFGEPIQRTSYFMGLVDKPMAPDAPIEKELRDLGIPRMVGFPSSRIGGREMNKDEYNELLTVQGKEIKDQLLKLITIPSYQPADKVAKIETIRKIVDRARNGLVIDQDGNSDYPLMGVNIMRPRVEMRALGIAEKLSAEELLALNKRMLSIDYKYMKDPQKKKAIEKFILDLRNSQ